MSSVPYIIDDIRGFLQLYSDGSVVRSDDPVKNHFQFREDNSVAFKDYLFDKSNNLHIRLFKPLSPPSSSRKLPIIVFFHGGGFCFSSCTWPKYHNCCLRLASELGALVVSADYRLAPENRLPAAIEDGLGALKWLKDQASCGGDAWAFEGVDFDRVFVLGDSSGGTITHHLAVRLGPGSEELNPLQVKGFSLPVGDTRDSQYANPFGPKSPSLEDLGLSPMLVTVGGLELLRDRAKVYAQRLKEMSKRIEYVEFEEKYHGYFTITPYSKDGDAFLKMMSQFMSSNST
ncbi:Alpha/beta hydrolase fold-3 [Dillenia turbinata]|uniref:Alpha/beta hydrolase fold-3 n=1 Tax=Dillenia turbinata TaxID=194707 RepID=A0AAN8WDY5_9MAGN